MQKSVYASTITYTSVKIHKWSIKVRGIFDRNYDYVLVPGKRFQNYGLEEQGDIAQDYYTLKDGGTIRRPYSLSDYAPILPFPT